MNADPENDRVDLNLLQRGDDLALNRLIARWERPLFAFAWRYVQNATDAHELVAELFVRLYRHRLNLRPDTKLAAWLFTALSNLCHNHHRWRSRHPTVSLDETGALDIAEHERPDMLATPGLGPGAAIDRDEALAALGAAIERLPHELKVTVLLHYYEGFSHREVGAITGYSERGVETRLYRARQRLRAELAEHLNETVRS